MTLVPKEIYINDKGMAKVMLALAKGKHTFDKRDTVKERDEKREIERTMKDWKS